MRKPDLQSRRRHPIFRRKHSYQGNGVRRTARTSSRDSRLLKDAAQLVVLLLFLTMGVLTILAVFFDLGRLEPEQKRLFANVTLIGITSAFFNLLPRTRR